MRTNAFIPAVLLCALASSAAASTYDQAVANLRPVMHLDTAPGRASDLSGHGHSGAFVGGTPASAVMPNGDLAASFNGLGQYLSVPHHPSLSVPTTGKITIVAWMRPGTLQFPRTENEDFVYFLGKGNASQGYEYANRMYSKVNSAGRPNRISFYEWNPDGGLGSGSYFQDAVNTSEWIMVTDTIDMSKGTIDLYKNGALRKSTPLSQYNVTPRMTSAPFNVGTRSNLSYFQGAVGKVAVFDRVLTASEMGTLYRAMTAGGSAGSPTPAPGAPAPGVPGAPPAVAAQQFAHERFLSPTRADGVNDAATFGAGAARVTIMDVRGREVFDATRAGAAIVWRGVNSAGQILGSGVYLARVTADGGETGMQSFVIVK